MCSVSCFLLYQHHELYNAWWSWPWQWWSWLAGSEVTHFIVPPSDPHFQFLCRSLYTMDGFHIIAWIYNSWRLRNGPFPKILLLLHFHWDCSQVWWSTPVIAVLRMPRQEDHELEDSLGCSMSSCLKNNLITIIVGIAWKVDCPCGLWLLWNIGQVWTGGITHW